MRPQSARRMHLQRIAFFNSVCMLFSLTTMRPSSRCFLRARRCHRAEAGVPARNPWNRVPDLGDRKARLASESDETQVELRLLRETPLAALPKSWREDSRLLIEANRRGVETCTPGDFSNSHFSLDLKCALRFSIPSLEVARKFFGRGNMDRIPFKQLPMIVKMAVWLVFNNAWWSLEEFAIDRLGLWKYMPYYKVANACVWDLAVATITALAVWRASGGLTRSTVH